MELSVLLSDTDRSLTLCLWPLCLDMLRDRRCRLAPVELSPLLIVDVVPERRAFLALRLYSLISLDVVLHDLRSLLTPRLILLPLLLDDLLLTGLRLLVLRLS